MFAGFVLAFAGNSPPDGWEFCHGQVRSKDDPTYQAIFDAIGTIHGGDGNPNFKLPDYRGMFLRGVDGDRQLDPEADQRQSPWPENSTNPGNRGDAVGSIQYSASMMPNNRFVVTGNGAHSHHFPMKNRGHRPAEAATSDMPEQGHHGIVPKRGVIGGNGSHTHEVDGGDPETRPVNSYVHWIIKL